MAPGHRLRDCLEGFMELLVLALGLLAITLAICEVARVLRYRASDIASPPRVKNMRLGKHDLVILRHPGAIRDEDARRLRADLESRLSGHTVLILGSGLDIEVLHRNEVGDDHAE